MPTKITKGADGKQYMDIPGVGTFEMPGEAADAKSGWQAGIGQKLGHMLMNPELISGAASLVPGVGTLAAGGIGAATSATRDLVEGSRDPMAIGGRALMHGAVDMIPGGIGKLVEKGAGAILPAAADVIGTTKLGTIGKAVRALVGGGEAAAPAAAAPGADLLAMELPGGVKIMSSEGLRQLTQKSVDLENAGAAPRTVQALDALIQRVQAGLQAQNAQPGNVLSRAGLSVTDAAGRAATAAAAKGASIANKIRLALGTGSTGFDALNGGGGY